VVGEPCCDGDDGQADGRREQHQTAQLLPNRNPHLDHPVPPRGRCVFRGRENGQGAAPRDAADISQLHFASAEQRARRGNWEACRVVCIPFLVACGCTCSERAGVSWFQGCWGWARSLAAMMLDAGVQAGVLE
jgi:hypothetical protein